MAKRIQIIQEATILDKSEKWIRELYQEADRKTAEKFGKNSLAYKTITNGIDREKITGSQFFWNTNLGAYLPKNQKVILLEDMEEINNIDESFLREFCTDSPQSVLRTKNPSYDKNKYILKDLIKQIKGEKYKFSSENPLIISNLELVKDINSKNGYGLLLKIRKNTKIQHDKRFAYSNDGKRIDFGKKTKLIYTEENGLSGVYLIRNGNLYSMNDDLAYSYGNGQVVVKDTKEVA